MTGFEIVTTFPPTWDLLLIFLVALALPVGGLLFLTRQSELTNAPAGLDQRDVVRGTATRSAGCWYWQHARSPCAS